MSRAPATQAAVKRHIEAARKAGLTVIGIRADGTVLVCDGEKTPQLVPMLLGRGNRREVDFDDLQA